MVGWCRLTVIGLMMPAPRFATTLFAVLLAATAVESARAEATTARQLVARFHGTLLDLMKNAVHLGVKGRYQKLAPEIEQTFHLKLMVRVSIGSYWKNADDGERDRLAEAFSQYSISTYASQFDSYSGQKFSIIGEKRGPQNTTLVSTRITNPGGDDVDLTYVTRQFKKKWRIVDVLLDTGISQLAVRRSEYRRILRSGGINSLIEALNTKARELVPD